MATHRGGGKPTLERRPSHGFVVHLPATHSPLRAVALSTVLVHRPAVERPELPAPADSGALVLHEQRAGDHEHADHAGRLGTLGDDSHGTGPLRPEHAGHAGRLTPELDEFVRKPGDMHQRSNINRSTSDAAANGDGTLDDSHGTGHLRPEHAGHAGRLTPELDELVRKPGDMHQRSNINLSTSNASRDGWSKPNDMHPSTYIIVQCPVCCGTGRNPEAPAAIADDDGTCLTCCYPLHPWYAAWHGQVRVPFGALVSAAKVQLREFALAGPGDDADR